MIVIVRGTRAAYWGSVYLDEHGEEDKELKYEIKTILDCIKMFKPSLKSHLICMINFFTNECT